jgi:hypothetical protein
MHESFGEGNSYLSLVMNEEAIKNKQFVSICQQYSDPNEKVRAQEGKNISNSCQKVCMNE